MVRADRGADDDRVRLFRSDSRDFQHGQLRLCTLPDQVRARDTTLGRCLPISCRSLSTTRGEAAMNDVSKRGLLKGALAVGAGAAAMSTLTRDAHAQLLESGIDKSSVL